MMRAKSKKENDRDGDADQPQQDRTHDFNSNRGRGQNNESQDGFRGRYEWRSAIQCSLTSLLVSNDVTPVLPGQTA